MGQSKKSEIVIYLNKGIETPLGLTSKTALQQAMLNFYYNANPDAVEEPCIDVISCEIFDGSIEIELYSTRSQNLDFQVGLLNDYLEQFEDIIEEVTYDKWVQAD